VLGQCAFSVGTWKTENPTNRSLHRRIKSSFPGFVHGAYGFHHFGSSAALAVIAIGETYIPLMPVLFRNSI